MTGRGVIGGGDKMVILGVGDGDAADLEFWQGDALLGAFIDKGGAASRGSLPIKKRPAGMVIQVGR